MRRAAISTGSITMREIGKQVGVSAVTVSKALAGKPGVGEEMRKKILKAARKMGYVNPIAVQAEERRTLNVGILALDRYFARDSYYAMFYKTLVQVLMDAGHFALMELLTNEDEAELTLPRLMQNGRVDGMILLGQPSREYLRMIAAHPIPVVFLDFYDEWAEADAVVGDNSYGCFRLTQHLIRNGHREIGFVGSIGVTTSIMDRYLGYYKAMLCAGLPIREEWLIPDRGPTEERLSVSLPEKLPTALVCNCDGAARLVIRLLRERGLRVPEDVSVVGFDDFSSDDEEEPALSTFRLDVPAMAQTAVQLLAQRCAGVQKPFGRVVVGGQPIYRDSERPLKNEV